MRSALLIILLLLAGCARIQNITKAECLPTSFPSEEVLKRQAYLYKFEDETEISLWNHPYRYGSGVDASGQMQMHAPPPLKKLPIGTQLTITKITRESHFDGSPNSIYARGIAHIDQEQLHFLYVWGIRNRIQYAPWEKDTYNSSDFSRVIECEI